MEELCAEGVATHGGPESAAARFTFTGSKTAAPIRSRASRCRRGRRWTRSISGRCCRPTTRRSASVERAFAAALKTGEVHITSPGGTDLRFRAGDRPANLQDGDASAARTAQGKVLVDHEIELPAGVVRVAPIEDTVEGVIAFPPSQWDGRPVDGLRLRFAKGRVVEITASQRQGRGRSRNARRPGTPAARSGDRARVQPVAGGAGTRAVDSLLGYGAGVVRLSLGDNTELGGAVAASPGQPAYVRWNFFTDLTVTVGNTTWVRNGQLP